MKSLEALKNIKREAGTPYFSMLYDIDMWYEDFETIQQSLEVLEIIKNKRVEVFPLLFTIRTNEGESNEYMLIKYNSRFNNKLYELTMEEFLKLKQWLEGNE